MRKILSSIIAFYLLSSPIYADNVISFNDAYMILMPTKSGGVFGELVNHTNEHIRIISAESPNAKKVELHNHVKDGDMMKMMPIDDIIIPANGRKMLKRGGIHIMVMGVDKELSYDETIEITLMLDNGRYLTQDIILKPLRFLKNK